jgi:prepilin peptidase CpaA
MGEFEIITAAPLLVLLAVATLIDWRKHRVPNSLSLGAALIGLLVQTSLSGPTGLAVAAGGWIVCLVCFLPFYVSGGMAAGDVKLMAAVGTFLGPMGGVVACVVTLVVGALIGLLCLGYEALLGASQGQAGGLDEGLRAKIPYAGAIAAGTALVVTWPTFASDVFALGSIT